MSNAAAVLAGVVWLSLVALAAVGLVLRAPKRRKPVDELEAADAALRLRINDLEDKFEAYTKREAVRGMRARKDAKEDEQQSLPLTKEQRLANLRARWAAQKGLTHGTPS